MSTGELLRRVRRLVGFGKNSDSSTNIQFKALTNHRGRGLRARRSYCPPIERSKVLERPSSPLRLRAACDPHAFHPTNEFGPPPSVRPRNLRMQEFSRHKGSLGSTSRISSLLTSMRVCALGLGSKVGRSKSFTAHST